MITVSGVLPNGVEREGVLHRSFVMRAATIDDLVAAIEAAGPGASVLRMRIHKAARQLVSMGAMTTEEIDGALLLALPEEDADALLGAQDAVEKKRGESRKTSAPSGSSNSSCASTASSAPAR